MMNPEHHDRVVGAISTSLIVAASLVNQVADYNSSNEWFHRLATGGFRGIDTSGGQPSGDVAGYSVE